MDKKLFLHIGTGKTGTSAIQKYLYENEAILNDYNFTYCKTGIVENNHHLLCRNYGRKDEIIQEDISNNLVYLNEEIRISKFKNHIISSEYFPGLFPEEIAELSKKIEAEIIPVLYIRRQDLLVESWYAQLVKAHRVRYPIKGLCEDLVNKNVLNYELLIKNWQSINTSESIIVRAFQKEKLYKGSVVNDFLKSVCPSFDHRVRFFEENKSIYPNQIIFARKISRHTDNPLVLNYLFNPISNLSDSSRYFMSASERLNLCNLYRGMNERISMRYFGGDNIFDYSFTDMKESSYDINFIENIVLNMYVNDRDKLVLAEDAVIRVLKEYIENEVDSFKKRRALVLGLLTRRDAPHISEMLIKNLGGM